MHSEKVETVALIESIETKYEKKALDNEDPYKNSRIA